MKHNFLTFIKGMAMGAADVVPGVSGGTIAFITGIYDTLLESIRRVNPSLISLWRKEGFASVWTHINGKFLFTLLAGILTSVFTLAKGISWALTTHPVVLWSFFFGLIIASILHMVKQIEKWSFSLFISLIAGAVFAYIITLAHPLALDFNPFTVFVAGSIAICAMILPGISGSFILLLLGMYAPVLAAAKAFDIATLMIFATGCLAGLLTFSHLLSWLLRRFRALTIAFLTGLLIGALGKIWPWKQAISWRTNSSGEMVPLVEQNLSPIAFESVTGQPALLGIAVVAMLGGFLLVWGLERVSLLKED